MLAIIDGDVLCYHACRPRWEKTAQSVNGVNVIRLDENGKRIPLEFSEEEDAQYLEESWEHLFLDLQELLKTVECDDFVMAVKGPRNFRSEMYPEYKINRHSNPDQMNKFVPELRRRAVEAGLAICAYDREADDFLRIWAREARAAEIPYVICSVDKDLHCIVGRHYLMHKGLFLDVTRDYATRFFYKQLLMGDSTDNIPGIRGIGPKKAEGLLQDCTTDVEMQTVVKDMYEVVYGDEWKDWLLSNGKMIYIQRKIDDYFDLSKWEALNVSEKPSRPKINAADIRIR